MRALGDFDDRHGRPRSGRGLELHLRNGEADPYYVLGSLVKGQSSIIAVGDCGSTFDELDAAYSRDAHARRQSSTQRDQVITADGCVYDAGFRSDCR